MTPKSEHLVDLIFKKLKTYENKKIFLEKESLNKFIYSLFKDNWINDLFKLTAIVKYVFLINKDMYSFSQLTVILTIIFIISLYLLFRVTSSTKN
mgnify:CR=1 FL=1